MQLTPAGPGVITVVLLSAQNEDRGKSQMPQQLSAHDVEQIFPEVLEIGEARLRGAVTEIWQDIAKEMSWSSLDEIPKNLRSEKERTLVEHIRGVTLMALHICETAQKIQGKPFDRDLLLAACLLHDVSKPLECEPDPNGAGDNRRPRRGRKSELGRQLPHATYATHLILKHGLSLELANLVVTHTHDIAIRGKTWEAAALFYADFADSDAGRSAANDQMFVQRWVLNGGKE